MIRLGVLFCTVTVLLFWSSNRGFAGLGECDQNRESWFNSRPSIPKSVMNLSTSGNDGCLPIFNTPERTEDTNNVIKNKASVADNDSVISNDFSVMGSPIQAGVEIPSGAHLVKSAQFDQRHIIRETSASDASDIVPGTGVADGDVTFFGKGNPYVFYLGEEVEIIEIMVVVKDENDNLPTNTTSTLRVYVMNSKANPTKYDAYHNSFLWCFRKGIGVQNFKKIVCNLNSADNNSSLNDNSGSPNFFEFVRNGSNGNAIFDSEAFFYMGATATDWRNNVGRKTYGEAVIIKAQKDALRLKSVTVTYRKK